MKIQVADPGNKTEEPKSYCQYSLTWCQNFTTGVTKSFSSFSFKMILHYYGTCFSQLFSKTINSYREKIIQAQGKL